MILDHAGPTSDFDFCVLPIGGLGNRLLVLAAGLRFLDKGYYSKMRIYWDVNDEMGAKMNEILSVDGNVYEGAPFENSPVLPLGSLPEIRVSTHDKLNISHFACFRSIEDNPNANLVPEWKIALQRVKYNRMLLSVADTIDVSDRIGIHCRRSDYWSRNHEIAARTYVKLDRAFATYLKAAYPNEKFFISTDSPFTTIFFEEEFGDRIIHYPKSNYPLWRSRDKICVKEAVVDHILLSRCKKIIADSTSTFSQTAAWMGFMDKEQWNIPHKLTTQQSPAT